MKIDGVIDDRKMMKTMVVGFVVSATLAVVLTGALVVVAAHFLAKVW